MKLFKFKLITKIELNYIKNDILKKIFFNHLLRDEVT